MSAKCVFVVTTAKKFSTSISTALCNRTEGQWDVYLLGERHATPMDTWFGFKNKTAAIFFAFFEDSLIESHIDLR